MYMSYMHVCYMYAHVSYMCVTYTYICLTCMYMCLTYTCVPYLYVHFPYMHVHVYYMHIHVPYIHIHMPYMHVHAPYIHMHVPYMHVHASYIHIQCLTCMYMCLACTCVYMHVHAMCIKQCTLVGLLPGLLSHFHVYLITCPYPQNCQLGQHVPLDKGIGEEGIVFAANPLVVDMTSQSTPPAEPSSGDSQPAATSTDDPNTSKRHGKLSTAPHWLSAPMLLLL